MVHRFRRGVKMWVAPRAGISFLWAVASILLSAAGAIRKEWRHAEEFLQHGRSHSSTSIGLRTFARSKAQEAAWLRHREKMVLTMTQMETTRGIANTQLDDVIEEFMRRNADSDDACSAQLMEAKQQLNSLHQRIRDLVSDVNATEHAISVANALYEENRALLTELEEKRDRDLAKCDSEKGDNAKKLAQLREELQEMQQIAGPDVWVDSSTGKLLERHPNDSASSAAAAAAAASASLLQSSASTLVAIGYEYDYGGSGGSSMRKPALVVDREFRSGRRRRRGMTDPLSKSAVPAPMISFIEANRKKGTDLPLGDLLAATKKAALEVARCEGQFPGATAALRQRKRLALLQQRLRITGNATGDLERVTTSAPQPAVVEVTLPKVGGGDVVTTTVAPRPPPKSSRPIQPRLWVPKKRSSKAQIACTTTSSVAVKIASFKRVLSAPRPMKKGMLASVPCALVDSSAVGAIWLKCEAAGKLAYDNSQCLSFGNTTRCEKETKRLQKIFSKAYVEITRLVRYYEDLVNGDCREAVLEIFEANAAPIQKKLVQLSDLQASKNEDLLQLRPQLQAIQETELKLRRYVQTLQQQCAQLPAATTDLQKVRDAIRALSICPGLSRVQFRIPKWVGSYLDIDLDIADDLEKGTKGLTDDQQDLAMDKACQVAFNNSYPGNVVRAAETSEIAEQAVEGMPTNNTATSALLGTCPGCEGADDIEGGAKHGSGHARICWAPGTLLSPETQISTCSRGQRALLCVLEIEDLNELSSPVKPTDVSSSPAVTAAPLKVSGTQEGSSTTTTPPAMAVL